MKYLLCTRVPHGVGHGIGWTARFWPVSCRSYWRAPFTASSTLPTNLSLTVIGQFAGQSIVKIQRCVLATENYGW